MSKVVITGNASGTGDFTIAAPNSNTNRTLTLPDEAGTIATTAFVTNRLLQNLNVTTGAVATGTTLIPSDDTIPQITEGDQYMSLAITPTSATSILEINVVWVGRTNGTVLFGVALFRDAVANALAASMHTSDADRTSVPSFTYRMVSGTVSEIIFRVRAGGNNANTTTFNGFNSARAYGGVMASSITIKEYAA